MKAAQKRLVNAKSIFFSSIFVAVLTCLVVWLWGIDKGHTLYQNALWICSFLSVFFFLFISIGLYKGIKLKDDLGDLTDKIPKIDLPDMSNTHILADMGESIGAFFSWLFISVLLIVSLWILSTIFWIIILVFGAMLYWVFFRALRNIFKFTPICKGNILASLFYGLGFTILYTGWIYAMLFAFKFIAH